MLQWFSPKIRAWAVAAHLQNTKTTPEIIRSIDDNQKGSSESVKVQNHGIDDSIMASAAALGCRRRHPAMACGLRWQRIGVSHGGGVWPWRSSYWGAGLLELLSDGSEEESSDRYEREREAQRLAEADRIWEARAPETCQIRSVAAIPRTAATGSGVSQLPWPPPRLSSPPPRRFARLSSSAAITLQGERHARQVRGSPDGCEKEREWPYHRPCPFLSRGASDHGGGSEGAPGEGGRGDSEKGRGRIAARVSRTLYLSRAALRSTIGSILNDQDRSVG